MQTVQQSCSIGTTVSNMNEQWIKSLKRHNEFSAVVSTGRFDFLRWNLCRFCRW
jgi:hypothetical protein